MVRGTIFPKPPITFLGIVLRRIRTIICGDARQDVLKSTFNPGEMSFFAVGRLVRHDVLPPTA
jgi:hypothetical protein